MANEIEHKFLVDQKRLPGRLPAGEQIEQGYLCAKPPVRIRIASSGGKSAAYLTIKGEGLRERLEFEYEIPVKDARQLMKMCGDRVVRKTRRYIGPWELDEFKGRHRGLWLAECELKSAHAQLPAPLPVWLGREVTEDPKYANVNLASSQNRSKKL